MKTKFIFTLSVLTSALLCQNFLAQEAKKTGFKDSVEIYDHYKDACVDVLTTIETENSKVQSQGSGCFIDENGHLITAAHVVKEENDTLNSFFGKSKIRNYQYEVILKSKNRRYSAKLVGFNVYVDAAILKVNDIDKKDYKVAKIGNSDKLKIGEKIYVIGSPFGASNSMTEGIVSQLHRYIYLCYVEDWIQISAAVNPGNSGGVLLNQSGEVVGIINAKNFGAEGMAYSLPINLANIPQLMKGAVKRGYSGFECLLENFPRDGIQDKPKLQDLISLNELTGIDEIETLITIYKNSQLNCAIVTEVKSESPAEKLGIKKGDIITQIAGNNVKNGVDVRKAFLGQNLPSNIKIKLLRAEGNKVKKIELQLLLEEEKQKKE